MLQYTYTTPQGNEVLSAEPMTEAQLRDWDELMEGYEQWLDEQDIESEEDYLDWQEQQAEDRDSDGYGWERAAADKTALWF
jgi:hypothetical protein